MLSEYGMQNVTFHCHHTYLDLSKFNIKLHTKNGMIYQMYSYTDDSLQYDLIQDQCRTKSHGQTILAIRTNKSVRLPIINLELINRFHRNDYFAIEIGPICFA